ncbi:MAG: CPBP family intramembrane metalloprotease [Lachnospiraceae bacterium]|nr:CPBP family intramembrane metalloprotease [Lachnospiraceae bacterium]MDE7273967.1 CPBP family intramembrane metalloprotease [Lachnospiraceae bacterium]
MEYNKNAGAGKKFLEGILVSFEIMVLFMVLQILVSFTGTVAAMSAYMIQTGNDVQDAQYALWDIMTDSTYMTTLTVVATFVSAIFSVPAYWIIWGRKRTEQDRQYFREKVLKLKPFAMIVIASCGLYYLAILISAVIAVVSPETMESYNEMMDMALGGSQMLAMLAAVILAPVNEECIMRGLILKNLQRFFSTPVVIIIQAVLFGIFHANWVQGIYVLPVGAALGYVAIKSRSVIPSIFMHLFYNMLSFVVILLPEFCQTGIFAISTVVVSAVAVWIMGRTEGA